MDFRMTIATDELTDVQFLLNALPGSGIALEGDAEILSTKMVESERFKTFVVTTEATSAALVVDRQPL